MLERIEPPRQADHIGLGCTKTLTLTLKGTISLSSLDNLSFKLLINADENLFFSPFSIFTALAMAYAGAKNLTESQMADVLKFNTD